MDSWNCTPEPGMLVTLQDGTWGVITGSGIHTTYYVLNHNSSNWYRDYNMTLLAPAPTLGGLWAAVCNLFTDAEHGITCGKTFWEAGALYSARLYPANTIVELEYHPMEIVLPKNYDAHMRDMQKFGALLAYCAQPGWDATR